MGIGWDWLLPAAAIAATVMTGGAAAPAVAAAEGAGAAAGLSAAEAAAAFAAEQAAAQAAAAAATEAAATSAAAAGTEAAAGASALPTAGAEAALSGASALPPNAPVDYASLLNPAQGAGVPEGMMAPADLSAPALQGPMTQAPAPVADAAVNATNQWPSLPKMSPEMQKGIKAAQLMNTLVNQPAQGGGNTVGTTTGAPRPVQGVTPMTMVGGQNPASWQGMQRQRPSLGQILYPQGG